MPFIVIDGTDGSGKGTQTKLLIERIRQSGREVFDLDFPQYGKKSAGPVEEYLNGKYGGLNDITPYQAAILFAVDRFDLSFEIKKQLAAGKIIVANRYVASNMGHQGAKIIDDNERQKFFEWLENLEYKIFNIPRPDLNIILRVPAEIAQKLVDQKEQRNYLGDKKRDIHEDSLEHLKKAEKIYWEIAQVFPNFRLIECVKDDNIMSIMEINNLIWEEITKII